MHCGAAGTVVLEVEPVRPTTPELGHGLRLCEDCATQPDKCWRLRWRPLVDG
jgi:hypothetical protein